MAELGSTLSFFFPLSVSLSLCLSYPLSYLLPPLLFSASPFFLSKELAKVLCPAEVPLSKALG